MPSDINIVVLLQGHGTVMNQIVTEMGLGVTMIAMMEEETATGSATMTGTAGTTIEEVSCCV